jgi:hypothetical protein
MISGLILVFLIRKGQKAQDVRELRNPESPET